MQTNKEEGNGDEMAHESADSDKSSSSSSNDSDSEDSSDMDEAECESRRAECIEVLTDLETQFCVLREQLYKERMQQLESKLIEAKLGRASEYVGPLRQLQENAKIRTEVAGVLRQLRLINCQNKFEAEELASRQNLESEKQLLKESIRLDIDDKLRRLEEERHNADISEQVWFEQTLSSNYGCLSSKSDAKSSDTGQDKKKKPVTTVTGPYIVYMLRDSEILEDWSIIKKALSSMNRKVHL